MSLKNSVSHEIKIRFLVVFFAAISSLPVPFAPVHLLFINLLTDSLPAIALGLEPHRKDVMKENPRSINEGILTKEYLQCIGMEGVVIGIVTGIAFLIGYQGENALLASTMAFGTLCMSRLVHGFNCKRKRPVIFTDKFFDNPYLIGAFVIGVILLTSVLCIPNFESWFHVQTLKINQLLIIYSLALFALLLIQIMKWLRFRRVH